MDIFSLLFILLFTVPVFYVWGLISFIRLIGKGSKNTIDRTLYLENAINDFKKQLAEKPDKKLTEVLLEYQNELHKLQRADTNESANAQRDVSIFEEPKHTVSPQPAAHSEASFQNWYKDNSINLLLYIGAFLIVVSATIFVGLNAASGISKSMLLSLLTILFLLSGIWLHTLPKVKNAGSAFTAIGALLIPISGLGWYNFVFRYTDVSSGSVWLLTSLIGLVVYIILAQHFRSIFYSYVSSFSTISFILAFIKMQALQSDFYVLGAILSSLLLLVASIYIKDHAKDDTLLYMEPLKNTANIALPVAILYGLFLTSQSTQFTLQATVSIFLGALFYVLSYRYYKKSEYVFAAQVLFTLGLIYFGFWQNMSTLYVLYLISASLVINMYFITYFKNQGKHQEALLASVFSLMKTTIIFLYAQSTAIAPLHLLIFALIAVVIGIHISLILSNSVYIGFSSVFLSVALYTLINNYLHYADHPYVLGFVYTIVAAAWYAGSLYGKNNKQFLSVCGFSSVFFFILSTLFISDLWRYQLVNAAAMTVIVFSASYHFAKKEFIFLGNFLLAFTVFCAVKLLHVHIELYPLIFIGVSFIYYLISTALDRQPKEEFRISGLVGAFVTTMSFGLYAANSGYYDPYTYTYLTNHALEHYALISSYATVFLYSYDAFTRRSRPLGYTASAFGLITYFWQLHYLGITGMQYYTLVTGAYFFTLANIERKRHNDSLKTLFDVTATFFLLVPTWEQSYGINGAMYALLLGGIGICFIIYSITYQDKWYRYCGIIAIILAVVSQSKWAIIGIVGLIFLGLALYLLIFRKEDKSPKLPS